MVLKCRNWRKCRSEIDAVVARARRHFQVDVTKACHHGSHHFSETFLKTLNAVVTVIISSGDNESYPIQDRMHWYSVNTAVASGH